MQAGGFVGVGVTERYDGKLLSFEREGAAFERLGNHQSLRDLIRKQSLVRSNNVRRDALPHLLNHGRSRDKSRAGKTRENDAGAEKMVAMTVCGIDRRQVLAARSDPVD